MADKDTTTRAKLKLGAAPGKPVRFSYLNVFKMRLNAQNGREEYSVQLLIPKSNTEDVKLVQDAIEGIIKATFTDAKTGKLKLPPGLWRPLRDGDTDVKQNGDPYGPECAGYYVLSAKTTDPVDVVGTTKDDKGHFVRLTEGQVQSGDWGRVSVQLYGFTKGAGGVAAGLGNLQFTRKGEALSSRTNADDEFKDFEDGDEGPDPLD